jgi:pyruvate dehydrogenase E2 component (dihydrolipoamide acetyltransferase)
LQTTVLLPQVELTMESATVARWLVAEGEHVRADQPIVEVETQKATTEIPSPAAGYVRRLLVKEGDVIDANARLCILTDTPDEPFEISMPPTPSPCTQGEGGGEGRAESAESGLPVKASPAARKIAKELGIDIAKVRGSGPGGRVTEQDVRASTASAAPSNDGWTSLPPTRLALIDLMRKSLEQIPQIHLQRRLDVTPLMSRTAGITFTHRLIHGVAAALWQHPPLRTIIEGNRIRTEPVSVAVAIDSPHGLVAPVVRDADRLSLQQIADAVAVLRRKAESNSLRREELSDVPFAISNLGMYGVDLFDAFVFYGQTAVLSVGRATESPSDAAMLAWFGLSVDHRIVDGAEAARFLQTLQTEILRR